MRPPAVLREPGARRAGDPRADGLLAQGLARLLISYGDRALADRIFAEIGTLDRAGRLDWLQSWLGVPDWMPPAHLAQFIRLWREVAKDPDADLRSNAHIALKQLHAE